MKLSKDLKEDMNKCLDEDTKSTEFNEMFKIIKNRKF